MIVTLRRAGRFDPAQFFRDDLIRINSFPAVMVHKTSQRQKMGDKPSILARLSRRRAAKHHVSTCAELLRMQQLLLKCLSALKTDLLLLLPWWRFPFMDYRYPRERF